MKTLGGEQHFGLVAAAVLTPIAALVALSSGPIIAGLVALRLMTVLIRRLFPGRLG